MFFLTCTGGRFYIHKSKNLIDWVGTGKKVINSKSGISSWSVVNKKWRTPKRSWAPHLTKIGDRYISYYTQNSSGGYGAIGVSETKNILTENFREILHYPLARNDRDGGIIDPSYFKDKKTGKHYILYKIDGNSKRKTTKIAIREMGPYGSGYSTKYKSVEKIIKVGGNSLDTLVEGQELVKMGNFYYLFYSHGSYLGSYKVKVARSKFIYGPYTGDRIVLSARKGSRFYGPGHGTYTEVRGKSYYFYHAYDRKMNNKLRYAMLDRIYWRNGWPIINDGHPSEGKVYSPLSKVSQFPTVLLNWKTHKLNKPVFSLDVRNNKVKYGACIDAGVLRRSQSLHFDGKCKQGKIDLLSTTEFRICAGEYGRFSRKTTVCSPYQRFDRAHKFITIKR
jgi:arabinan endo-1,5-alpha-L-arabinosidase